MTWFKFTSFYPANQRFGVKLFNNIIKIRCANEFIDCLFFPNRFFIKMLGRIITGFLLAAR